MKSNIIIDLVEKKINNMKNFFDAIQIRKVEKVIYEKPYGFADISKLGNREFSTYEIINKIEK